MHQPMPMMAQDLAGSSSLDVNSFLNQSNSLAQVDANDLNSQILANIHKYLRTYALGQQVAQQQQQQRMNASQPTLQLGHGSYDSLLNHLTIDPNQTAPDGNFGIPPSSDLHVQPSSLYKVESQETAKFSQQMSSSEFQTLQSVVHNLNCKVLEMAQQTKTLETKLYMKTKELKMLKKRQGSQLEGAASQGTVGRSSYSRTKSRNVSTSRSRGDFGPGKPVVVAREKGTQTPVSHLSAKQTRIFLNQKHSEIMEE